jgi:hypothetical protein
MSHGRTWREPCEPVLRSLGEGGSTDRDKYGRIVAVPTEASAKVGLWRLVRHFHAGTRSNHITRANVRKAMASTHSVTNATMYRFGFSTLFTSTSPSSPTWITPRLYARYAVTPHAVANANPSNAVIFGGMCDTFCLTSKVSHERTWRAACVSTLHDKCDRWH